MDADVVTVRMKIVWRSVRNAIAVMAQDVKDTVTLQETNTHNDGHFRERFPRQDNIQVLSQDTMLPGVQ